MSMSSPESDLSSDQLAQLSGFKRDFADLLDQVLVDGLDTSGYVNVVDYGAVGDGVTNDTAAIVLAFTAGITQNLPVLFPMTLGGGRFLVVSSNPAIRQPAIQLDSSFSHLRLVGARGAGIKVDSFFVDGVSGSPAIRLLAGFHDLDIEGLSFYGANSDDKDTNFFAAIEMFNGSSDLRIRHSLFDHITPVNAVSPTSGTDTVPSARLTMTTCLMHNCPNGVHPPSDTKIVDCYFICDTLSATRAQAIYSFGTFGNLQISGCTFRNITKQAVQYRGVEANWNHKQTVRIVGNHFENCDQYAIFCGSDSFPTVTQAIISNNTFLNCNGPIQCQGQGSATITGNIIHYNWEWPFGPVAFSVAIFAGTGVGLPGHYAIARGIVIANNKISHMQPYLGKVLFNTNPADGDTITVGGIVYRFKDTPSATWDIQRDGILRGTVDNFVRALQGYGSGSFIPNANNVLRSTNDAFNDALGTAATTAYIASYFNFTLSHTGGFATITASSDYRLNAVSGIQCSYLIAPTIVNNNMDDFVFGVVVQGCRSAVVYDNVNTNQNSQAVAIIAQYNVDNRYRGNRCVTLDFLNQGQPIHNQYFDGFSIIDDDHMQLQNGNNGELLGRAGIATIGDGKAFCWLWYGQGIAAVDPADPSTELFRWRDGDRVILYDGSINNTFMYKFVSPGAGEFNSADSLIALISAVPGFTAAYQTFQNWTAIADPKTMIRVSATAAGTAGNAAKLYVYRDKYPGGGDPTSTQQPLINGYILRNVAASEEFSPFGGGNATRVTTFVFSPIANPDRGVEVWGADAAAVALNPHVYQADIIPGVGFLITHGVGAGTEKFYYRVNSQ